MALDVQHRGMRGGRAGVAGGGGLIGLDWPLRVVRRRFATALAVCRGVVERDASFASLLVPIVSVRWVGYILANEASVGRGEPGGRGGAKAKMHEKGTWKARGNAKGGHKSLALEEKGTWRAGNDTEREGKCTRLRDERASREKI